MNGGFRSIAINRLKRSIDPFRSYDRKIYGDTLLTYLEDKHRLFVYERRGGQRGRQGGRTMTDTTYRVTVKCEGSTVPLVAYEGLEREQAWSILHRRRAEVKVSGSRLVIEIYHGSDRLAS